MFLVKRGSTYYIEYVDNSSKKSKRVSTGKKKKSEAAKIMEQFAKGAHTSNDHTSEADKKKRRTTIGAFEERYEKYVKAIFSKPYLEIVGLSLKMMKRDIETIYMDEISYDEAERFIVKTFSRSPYTASQYLRTLKAAFT